MQIFSTFAMEGSSPINLPIAFRTAGDAVEGGLPFGWDVADLQNWTLIYLAVSSLAFIAVWVIGFLRR